MTGTSVKKKKKNKNKEAKVMNRKLTKEETKRLTSTFQSCHTC